MKSPDLFTLISGFFLTHLAAEKNISKHTAVAYRDGMKLLLKFASNSQHCQVSKLQIAHFTPDFIHQFLNYLETVRGNSIRTQNARLAMIHSFFAYVMIEDPLSAGQCQRIVRIPQKRGIHPTLAYLTGEEVGQILRSIDRSTSMGRRDYVLLALLYDTGARVQEVLDLRPCDFRFDSPVHVKLTGKGHKERLCPLLPQTARLVLNFLKEQKRINSDSDLLFQSRGRQNLSRHGVRYILNKYVTKTRNGMESLLRRAISPHSLRHSKAVHLLQSGVPLVTIKDFLGHADLRTTQIYAETDLEAKRKALQHGGSPVKANKVYKIPSDILRWLESL